MGAGVGSVVSVCAVGVVCKDSNSLKSARSILCKDPVQKGKTCTPTFDATGAHSLDHNKRS